MACYHPLHGYRAAVPNASGKRGIVFNPAHGFKDLPVTVPCGQCIGCRLERSRQWAIRCMHEASLHEDNCFITLTYNNEHLPADGSLNLDHFQRFMKRLRKKFGKVRFFHCGEYGELNSRPHYHACIFGFDFPDRELFSSRDNIKLYRSKSLEQLWPYGFATIGDVTFESAAYVARYIMKKVNGERAEDHYKSVDLDSGEVFDIKPEYVTMSRRPGIAAVWFEKFGNEVYPDDFVVIRGKKMRPPKFYDALLERTHSELFDKVKDKRVRSAITRSADELSISETVKMSQIKLLKREL